MSNLKVYEYNKQPIEFNTGESDVMINATHMGKVFGKKPNHFLSIDQTKDFVRALELKAGITAFKTVKGRHHAGTWMHKKLALKFAGWLNPEFELWVYDRILRSPLRGNVCVQSQTLKIISICFANRERNFKS